MNIMNNMKSKTKNVKAFIVRIHRPTLFTLAALVVRCSLTFRYQIRKYIFDNSTVPQMCLNNWMWTVHDRNADIANICWSHMNHL